MPRGLYFCLIILGSFAVVGLLSLLLAPFDIGTYTVNGESLSGPQFLRRAGALVAVFDAVAWVALLGLLRRRRFARVVLLALPLAAIGAALYVAVSTEQPFTFAELVVPLALVAAFGLYLFRRRSVEIYFASAREGASAP